MFYNLIVRVTIIMVLLNTMPFFTHYSYVCRFALMWMFDIFLESRSDFW